MKKYRFLCLILAALLCVSAPVSVSAQNTASASQTGGCVSLLAQKPLWPLQPAELLPLLVLCIVNTGGNHADLT